MGYLSVIIPTCVEGVPLADCLHSLLHQTLPPNQYEILVINNGSQTHSEKNLQPLLASLSGNIRLIQAGKNLGYGGGCCLGVQHAKGDLLFFHNDDSVADPCWLALARSVYRQIPDIGVIGCRIVSKEAYTLRNCGVRMVHPNGNFHPLGWGEPDGYEDSAHSPWGDEVPFFSGDVWATPRRVWDQVGGLGTCYYPGYYEDSEYGLRCRQLGYRIHILSPVTCSHAGSLTLGEGSPRYWRAFHRSRYLFLMRNIFPDSLMKILRTEYEWWRDTQAGQHPVECMKGLLSALPLLPVCLWNRYKFRKKIIRGIQQPAEQHGCRVTMGG